MTYFSSPGITYNFKHISYFEFLNQACEILNINLKELQSKKRTGVISRQRGILIAIINNNFKVNTIKLGSLFNRNHATCIYWINAISQSNIVDKKLHKEYLKSLNKLQQYYFWLQ